MFYQLPTRASYVLRVFALFLLPFATPEADAQMLSSGQTSCYLVVDGNLKCWGRNDDGQLGLGDPQHRGDNVNEMGDDLPTVDLGTGLTATAVISGMWHTCALLDDGSVKCWGVNTYGQLGQGDVQNRGDGAGEMGDDLPPINLGTGVSATAVAAGNSHNCAILDDGSLKCWGANGYGQLGQGDAVDRGDHLNEMGDNLAAIALGTGTTATAVAAGIRHSCAVLNGGSVKCWGRGDSGRLGYGDVQHRGDNSNEMGDNLATVDLGTGRTAQSIVTGYDFTCVLLDDGNVKCWGQNNWGQLGLEDTMDRGDNPAEMGDALPPVDLGTGRTAKAITSGSSHVCALLDDDTVKCWGANGGGQLGRGDTANRGDDAGEMGDDLPVVELGTGRTATAIAGGRYTTTCATLDDGSLKCWGRNTYGQLGIGDAAHRGDHPNEMGDNLSAVDLGAASLPVELTSFTAALSGSDVILSWQTAAETNNAGFEVQHRTHGQWQPLGHVVGAGTTTEVQRYRYRVDGSAPGTHRFRLKQTDFDGTTAYSPEVEIMVTASRSYSLQLTGAHPVRDAARLQITVARTQHVEVSVYDAIGRHVTRLHHGIVSANVPTSFEWRSAGATPGLYVVRLAGDGFSATRRIVVVR